MPASARSSAATTAAGAWRIGRSARRSRTTASVRAPASSSAPARLAATSALARSPMSATRSPGAIARQTSTAFFAVLTDERRSQLFSERERAVIRRHVPWTALVRQGNVRLEGGEIDLIPHLRRHRNRFVIKPNDEYGGTGVTLGWETSEAQWDGAIARALAERERGWIAQEKIAVRREIFPMCANGGVEMRDMLVDFAPYLFRGALAGFLTRLSATGLANVTSGGGQVPAFVVTGKMD